MTDCRSFSRAVASFNLSEFYFVGFTETGGNSCVLSISASLGTNGIVKLMKTRNHVGLRKEYTYIFIQ